MVSETATARSANHSGLCARQIAYTGEGGYFYQAALHRE
ncbi:MAG: hypothetical protein ACI8P9_000827 [Parasphingorhabdus sp.]|jgi:hypothetical protein